MKKSVTCASCGETYQVDLEKFGGRKIRCKKCGGAIPVPTAVLANDEFEVVDDATKHPSPPAIESTGISPAMLDRHRTASRQGAVNIALLQRKEKCRAEVREAFFQVYGGEENRILAVERRKVDDTIHCIDKSLSTLQTKLAMLSTESADLGALAQSLEVAKEVLSTTVGFQEGASLPESEYGGLVAPRSEELADALAELGETVYALQAQAQLAAEAGQGAASTIQHDKSILEMIAEIEQDAASSSADQFALEPRIEQAFARLAPDSNDQHKSIYRSPNIPERKLEGAQSAYASLEPEEKILCLVDNTLFGSAKEGCVVTTKGVHWREALKSTGHVSYRELVADEIVVRKKNVLLGANASVNLYLLNDDRVAAFARFFRVAALLAQGMSGETPNTATSQQQEVPSAAARLEADTGVMNSAAGEQEAWRTRDYRSDFPGLCHEIACLPKKIDQIKVLNAPKSAGGWLAAVVTYGASVAVSTAVASLDKKQRAAALTKEAFAELGRAIYAKYGDSAGPKGIVALLAELYQRQQSCRQVVAKAVEKVDAAMREYTSARIAALEGFEKCQHELRQKIADASEQVRKGAYEDAQSNLRWLIRAVPCSHVAEVLVLMSQVSYGAGNAADAARSIQDAICFGATPPVGADPRYHDLWAKAAAGLPAIETIDDVR